MELTDAKMLGKKHLEALGNQGKNPAGLARITLAASYYLITLDVSVTRFLMPLERRSEDKTAEALCKVCRRLFDQARKRLLFPDVVDLLTDKGYIHSNVWGPDCPMCKMLRQLAGLGNGEYKKDTVVLKAFAEGGAACLGISISPAR